MANRILFLSDSNSEHTEKWVLGLADLGFEIGLFSFKEADYDWFSAHPKITSLNSKQIPKSSSTFFIKIAYLRMLPELKKIITEFKPDILHAHYATSYGYLARLSGFKPYFISAWGTDVMKFPYKNIANKLLLKKNLEKAAQLFATSNTIKKYIQKITNAPVTVIPFGVDIKKYIPREIKRPYSDKTIVIGVIKPIEKIYAIDIIIKAFSLLVKRCTDCELKLMIVGIGSEKSNLEKLCKLENIAEQVNFVGRVNFSIISDYFNMIDVLVNVSTYESFGVSVIEAMACEKPVIVSNVGGLKEIVEEGLDGFLIPVNDFEKTSMAIEKLVKNKELRKQFGINGRQKVIEKYNWDDNLNQMAKIYLEN
ncbi:MAG: glycosyltransferase family 4 protein [Bacteroidia bacterium]